MKNQRESLNRISKYPKEVVIANVVMAVILVVVIAFLGYMLGDSLGKLIYNLRH